jgi:hypothetical protein
VDGPRNFCWKGYQDRLEHCHTLRFDKPTPALGLKNTGDRLNFPFATADDLVVINEDIGAEKGGVLAFDGQLPAMSCYSLGC